MLQLWSAAPFIKIMFHLLCSFNNYNKIYVNFLIVSGNNSLDLILPTYRLLLLGDKNGLYYFLDVQTFKRSRIGRHQRE